MFSFSLAYVLVSWVVRIGLLLAITGRRWQSGSVVAWLFVVFLQPWIGLVLYLTIGRDALPRKRIERRSDLVAQAERLIRYVNDHREVTRPVLLPEQASLVQLAERLGNLPILGGNSVELMTDTNEVIDRLVADIDVAREHVHLLFYIFAADATGERVLDALLRARDRGVTCRLLVDASGSRAMLQRWRRRILAAGIELSVALPVGLVRLFFARMDLRNHRKVVVIDGVVGFTGSQNIVDANYGHRDLAWHDLMVRITGPGVLQLQAVFVGDWYVEQGLLLDSPGFFPVQAHAGEIPLQVLPSGPSYPVENYQRMVVHSLHVAQRDVVITTPYFIPDESFLQAMQTARLRGVRVRLILPAQSDQILVGSASRAYYSQLLDMGVEVFLFTRGLLHAKTMVVDEELTFLGSSNFDIRSFALNYEINLVLYGGPANETVRAEHAHYFEGSRPLDLLAWRNRPRLQRALENIARIFSPIL